MRHILAIAALFISIATFAGPTTVWTIGTADRSYRDLAIAGNYAAYPRTFAKGVTFTVGTSRADKDWPYILPGPQDSWAGGRTHKAAVLFDLPAAPQGVCRLTINLCNTHYQGAPTLAVSVNKALTYSFQTPTGGTDASLTDPAAGKPYQIAFLFPASALVSGRNTVTIENASGAWALFDSLQLESDVPAPTSPVVTGLSAGSTMLFRMEGGVEKQCVSVILNNAGIEGNVEFTVRELAGVRQSVKLGPGSNRLTIGLPPAEKRTKLTLVCKSGGKEASVPFEIAPERRWTLFVAPAVHTDIGYTDLQENVYQRHLANTARALEAAKTTPGFRWNLETTFQADLWSSRNPARKAELEGRLKSGVFGVQGMFLNMLTGLCSGEEMLRVFRPAQDLGTRIGFKPKLAAVTDVPSTVGTMPTLLADCGYRYFIDAVNQDRGPVFAHADQAMHHSPFWWVGPDGQRVIALFTFGYGQGGGLGFRGSLAEVERLVPDWLRGFEQRKYVYDDVLAYGMFSDNEAMDPAYATIAREWNTRYSSPRIVIGSAEEFFADVERKYGADLPVFKGDMGSYWEDGAGSSAYETALTREARTKLENSTRLLGLAAARGNGATPAAAAAAAWRNILFYDEHTWGAAGSIWQPEAEQTVKQWAVKAQFALDALKQGSRIAAGATPEALGITGKQPGGSGVVVTNALSWPRDITCSISPAGGGLGMKLVDAQSGAAVPVQRVGSRWLFVARSVPALGWRSYRLEAGSSPAGGDLLRPGSEPGTWSSDRFTIAIDPVSGGIRSLKDVGGKEWVNTGSAYTLGQFIHVVGGNNDSAMVHPFAAAPVLSFRTHTAATAQMVYNGPVSAVIKVTKTGGDAPPVDTYIIVDAAGGLTLRNVIHKKPILDKEGAYFAFPFATQASGSVRAFLDVANGTVEAETGQMTGACREWFSAVTAMAVVQPGATAIVASPQAPLFTLNDVWKGGWRASIKPLNGALFSYALNNYWHTNYKASQGGDMVFEYALSLGDRGFSPVALHRAGAEASANAISATLGSDADAMAVGGVDQQLVKLSGPATGSLAEIKSRTAILTGVEWTGKQLVVRLFNPSSQDEEVTLGLPGCRITRAASANLVGAPDQVNRASARRGGATIPVRANGSCSLLLGVKQGR